MRFNIMLTVAYDGTNYHGWQWQDNAKSIQELLERALAKIYQEPVRVQGAGRTDAGVHAQGQVVNFYTNSKVPLERLPYAINGCLPPDVVVKGAQVVDAGFHARKSARSKLYRYTLDTGYCSDPFWVRYAWHPHYRLDKGTLERASRYLVGTHDYSSFRAAGSPVKTSTRTISRLTWDFSHPHLWHMYIEANGFLYKMVRIIVGTLVEVARGKYPPEAMAEILKGRDRNLAGPTAPAKGLCLWEVKY